MAEDGPEELTHALLERGTPSLSLSLSLFLSLSRSLSLSLSVALSLSRCLVRRSALAEGWLIMYRGKPLPRCLCLPLAMMFVVYLCPSLSFSLYLSLSLPLSLSLALSLSLFLSLSLSLFLWHYLVLRRALALARAHRAQYRDTSPMKNCSPLGPYSRPVPRALWWFWGAGGALSYERGSPVRVPSSPQPSKHLEMSHRVEDGPKELTHALLSHTHSRSLALSLSLSLSLARSLALSLSFTLALSLSLSLALPLSLSLSLYSLSLCLALFGTLSSSAVRVPGSGPRTGVPRS